MAADSPHTFCVFERAEPAGNAIPLLGRIVANPRRPLDAYRPRRDKSTGDEGHESKLNEFELDVAVERNATISATAVKNINAEMGLGSIFKAKGSIYREHERRLTSKMMRTYALEQYSDVFQQIYGEDNQSLVREFWKASSGQAYLVVSLRSAVHPSTEDFTQNKKSGELGGKLPLAAATAGHVPPKILDPRLSMRMKMSQDAATRGVAVGEVVFAAEYCEVIQDTNQRFSLRNKTTTYRVRGVKRFNAETLAFGSTGEDDEADEDESDDEGNSQDQSGDAAVVNDDVYV